MMVGLQGSGKTTTVGKLARWLHKIHKRKPLLVAADVYRPAAVQQLQVIGEKLGMSVFTGDGKTRLKSATRPISTPTPKATKWCCSIPPDDWRSTNR